MSANTAPKTMPLRRDFEVILVPISGGLRAARERRRTIVVPDATEVNEETGLTGKIRPEM